MPLTKLFKCFGVADDTSKKKNLYLQSTAENLPTTTENVPAASPLRSSKQSFLEIWHRLSKSTFPVENAQKSNDIWSDLQCFLDGICSASGVPHASLTIFSSSKKYSKVIFTGNIKQKLLDARTELWECTEVPGAYSAVSSRVLKTYKVALDSPLLDDGIPSDLAVLRAALGCTFFVCLPVEHHNRVCACLTLANNSTGADLQLSGTSLFWMSQMLGMYMQQLHAVQILDKVECLYGSKTLNDLAWSVLNELPVPFDSLMPEDVETRLLLLSPDDSSVTILARSNSSAANASISDMLMNSLYSTHALGYLADSVAEIKAGAARIPGQQQYQLWPSSLGFDAEMNSAKSRALLVQGMSGITTSLSNTLIKRCLGSGRQLVVVGDLMAALKRYGEPWKDVFLESPLIQNPSWLVLAPLVATDGQTLGAVMWLSSSRCNPDHIMGICRTSIPAMLPSLAHNLAKFAPGKLPAVDRFLSSTDASSAWHLVYEDTEGQMATDVGIQNMHDSTLRTIILPPTSGAQTPSSFAASKLRLQHSESFSTASLLRTYQGAIMHSLKGPAPHVQEFSEELQIVRRVGVGSTAVVLLANWRGRTVAAKLVKRLSEGRTAMRAAWEMAVIDSLTHPSVVTVHAIFADAQVEHVSGNVLRCRSAKASDLTHSNSQKLPPRPAPDSFESIRRPSPSLVNTFIGLSHGIYQVILLEYCDRGALNHLMKEPIFRQPTSSAFLLSASALSEYGCALESLSCNMRVLVATLADVACAMTHLHARALVHCDLKPENILLRSCSTDFRGFVAKVTDFGMAELFTPDGPLMGDNGGTVTHLAPEVAAHGLVSPAADVYSFGIIMWELYTGLRPYSDMVITVNNTKIYKQKAVLNQVVHAHMRPVFERGSAPSYVTLAKRCWDPDPLARPSFADITSELSLWERALGTRRNAAASEQLPGRYLMADNMGAGGPSSSTAQDSTDSSSCMFAESIPRAG